jgi:PAS domain S-box-containing protein
VEWRAVVEALAEPVLACGEDGALCAANPAAGRLLAWEPDALLGQPLSAIVPPRLHAVEGQPVHRYLLARAPGLGGRAVRATVLRRDGLELEVDLVLSTAPRPGPAGGTLLVATARPRQESVPSAPEVLGAPPPGRRSPEAGAARAGASGAGSSEAESHRRVFEHAPIGILHFDARGVITACNDAFVGILGSSRQVLVGLDMRTLPDPQMAAAVRRVLGGERAGYAGDYRSATSGKVTAVRVDFAPIRAPDGGVSGGVGLVTDVTEARRAEEALRRSEAALAQADRMASLGTLAAGVAHEINTPLSYVATSMELALGQVQAMRGDPAGAAGHLELLASLLANAQEGTERVRTLVQDLKTFSRADDPRQGRVDVEEVLEGALGLVGNELRHRARVVRDYGGVPAVRGAASRLSQVFVNLLVNAAQALPDGGHAGGQEVRVRTRREGARVRVEVSDTGSGIPPEQLGRIFEPFWTTKPAGVGTGLGLAICHGIVSALGGSIHVESEPGRGTTFRVLLPASEGEEAAAPPPAPPRPALTPPPVASAGGRRRLLLVDDSERFTWTLRLALQDRFDVTTAVSGRDALGLLLAPGACFDLVLCDLMMPDMTGMDVYEALQRERPGLEKRLVFMTGGAFTERAAAFLRQVGNRRLEKPFRPEAVDALLEG